MTTVLEIRNLAKSFREEGTLRRVVSVPSLDLGAAEALAVTGSSGSGKTTLLLLIAGLLEPDAGSVRVNGVTMTGKNEAARDRLRRAEIGMVFQDHHLIPGLTVRENAGLGAAFGQGIDRQRLERLLEHLGLEGRARARVETLSRGERQRVAIARALLGRPRVVLADEPTASLDPDRAGAAVRLIRDLCREEGAALLFVTHDTEIAATFERGYRLPPVEAERTG